MISKKCVICGKEFDVRKYRSQTAKYCSYRCRGKGKTLYESGENSAGWTGGQRTKVCQHCEKEFSQKDNESVTYFRERKFCSQNCSVIGQKYRRGEDHPNYSPTARRKNRGGPHKTWVNAVISRDGATCQHCGARNIELHAHHIKSYRDHPELRFELNNGITLCYRCHYALHTALTAKAVKSVEPRTVKAEGNTEPSSNRKVLEGVTTRGRVYRRWFGECDWCKTQISKQACDVKGKVALFCSKHCMGKWMAAHRTYRRWRNPERP